MLKDKILLTLIELFIKEKKYKDASNYATKYFDLTKPITEEKIKIVSEAGQLFLYLKEYDNAGKYFKYIADNATTSAVKNMGIYWSAETYLLEKNLDQALKLFNKLIKDPSWKEKSTFKIAQIYLKQKKLDKAAEVLKLLTTEFPKSQLKPSPLFLYAITLKKIKQNSSDAINYFIKFAKSAPTDTNASEAYFEAATLSMKNHDYEQAIDYFQKILTNYKDSKNIPNVLYKLMYANSLADKNDIAVQYAEKLIEKYPKSKFAPQAAVWLINYYKNNTEYDKAIAAVITSQKEFEKKPQIISELLFQKAEILYLNGKKTEALKTIEEVESDYSNTSTLPECLFLKGDILSSEGKYFDAIASYLKTTQTSNNNDLNNAAWGRTGDCYFAKINYDKKNKNELLLKATEYYNKILDSASLSPLFKIQTLYKLGKCYELLNKKEKAITMFHQAVYSIILDIKNGKNPSKQWLAKSGIALAKLLQEKHTPTAAKAAIDVYKILIKNNIEPKEYFQKLIEKINKKYRF